MQIALTTGTRIQHNFTCIALKHSPGKDVLSAVSLGRHSEVIWHSVTAPTGRLFHAPVDWKAMPLRLVAPSRYDQHEN